MTTQEVLKIRDDRGRKSEWRRPPARVVSLVPSDTYSIVRLGAKARLIGRTRYCVAPAEAVADIPTFGGTKDADVDAIIALLPDVVIANQEENTQRDIERLEAAGLKVFVSFPKTFAAGVAHLARLARLLGLDDDPTAKGLVSTAYHAHQRALAKKASLAPVRTFVPIWSDPWMTANGDTFISDVLDLVGAHNVFADRERRYPLAADLGQKEPLSPEKVAGRDTRYPRIDLSEVLLRDPELVLLPDEPHAFTEADAKALCEAGVAREAIVFCDGKPLMWHGAMAVDGLAKLETIVEEARKRRGSSHREAH